MESSTGVRWSLEDQVKLLDYKQPVDWNAVSAVFGRSVQNCKSKYYQLPRILKGMPARYGPNDVREASVRASTAALKAARIAYLQEIVERAQAEIRELDG